MKSIPLTSLQRKRKALAVVQFFFFSGKFLTNYHEYIFIYKM